MRILHIFAVIVSIILESIGAAFLLNTPTLDWKESNIIALVAMALTALLLIPRQKSEAEKALLERYYPIFRKINIVGSGSIGSSYMSASLIIDDHILVDVPNGIIKYLKHLNYDILKIDTIIITHLHGDHFFDLPF